MAKISSFALCIGDLILADLLEEGYAGDELLAKFRERQSDLHAAVKHLISDSGEVARNFNGVDKTEALFSDVMSG
ncbi:hypothetical protein SY83_09885 [Paenibacillus swuensis]|uniref:Uncharacterized protein n=1 Tax=Paenibacillus swuensis TaxID=1178515 RepID=A0A172THK9_9BACL|nr:hypothetical protein [Paenibacillus swuensis]ANE46539.1 hypothetical protein SY83_09885 [Paenibacillus swuensis]